MSRSVFGFVSRKTNTLPSGDHESGFCRNSLVVRRSAGPLPSAKSKVLRARGFYGLQFNRQFPIERFIVDFICRKIKLIVEIDGYSHQYKRAQDLARDRRLKELGFKVVRIPESDVVYDLDNAIRTLEYYLPEEIIKKSP